MSKSIEQTITSMEVAEMVEKDHRNLTRDIKKYVNELETLKIEQSDFFTESTYTNNREKTYPCYLVTKKGCEFIANKLTGIKGTEFTATYINRFHTMEETYNNGFKVNDLSPELQMFNQIFQCVANQQLQQKRQAAEIESIKESQQSITETFQKQPEDDFKTWVNKCVGKIAESDKYPFRGSEKDKYKQIRYESYERLNKKKPCRLDQRVEAEKGRAFSAGASKAKINAINKLSIIEGDKALRPIYETVIKEMMIAYCVGLN